MQHKRWTDAWTWPQTWFGQMNEKLCRAPSFWPRAVVLYESLDGTRGAIDVKKGWEIGSEQQKRSNRLSLTQQPRKLRFIWHRTPLYSDSSLLPYQILCPTPSSSTLSHFRILQSTDTSFTSLSPSRSLVTRDKMPETAAQSKSGAEKTQGHKCISQSSLL